MSEALNLVFDNGVAVATTQYDMDRVLGACEKAARAFYNEGMAKGAVTVRVGLPRRFYLPLLWYFNNDAQKGYVATFEPELDFLGIKFFLLE